MSTVPMSHSPCVPSHLKNGLNSECEYHHYFSDYHNHSKRPQLCTAKHNCGTHANLTGQAGKIFARIIKLWSGVCIARKWINFQLEVLRGCRVTVVQTGWSLLSGLDHSVWQLYRQGDLWSLDWSTQSAVRSLTHHVTAVKELQLV